MTTLDIDIWMLEQEYLQAQSITNQAIIEITNARK